MKKLIGRLLAIVLIAALAVCGIVTYNGYRLYKEVTEAVPVSEKVAEIEDIIQHMNRCRSVMSRR